MGAFHFLVIHMRITFNRARVDSVRPAQVRTARAVTTQAVDTDFISSASSVFGGASNKIDLALLSTIVLASSSVVGTYASGLSVEKKKAELTMELERERRRDSQLKELQSVIARYRGPLLESAIDLEQRLWHAIVDRSFEQGDDKHVELEVMYMVFCLAQFLGFVEVVRREGPREVSFLAADNPQGSDTLFIMIEAIRFVLCASPESLMAWWSQEEQGRGARNHPGARRRREPMEIIKDKKSAAEGRYSHEGLNAREYIPLRISRGFQRAIGTMMILTDFGASRHYTLSYGQFYELLNDVRFTCTPLCLTITHALISCTWIGQESAPNWRTWFADISEDVAYLAKASLWEGEGPFPLNKWTRVLLLQQLLVELIDLLDPDCIRITQADRRKRLMPVEYQPLPNIERYQRNLMDIAALGSTLSTNGVNGFNGFNGINGTNGFNVTNSANGVKGGNDDNSPRLAGLQDLIAPDAKE